MKNFIIDVYNKAKEGNLLGIIYSAVSTYGILDLIDIDEFVENSNSDMLYLKSKLTNTELDIYKWDIVSADEFGKDYGNGYYMKALMPSIATCPDKYMIDYCILANLKC